MHWVTDAAALPLAFAQVREDPALDRWVIAQAGKGARVIMVASGGCTAAALAADPAVASLHLVDANPAQMALARLKLSALATLSTPGRLALFGHAAMDPTTRGRRLAGALEVLRLPGDALGPPDLVAECGPDHAGRYERLFARLRAELLPEQAAIEALFALHEPAEQGRRVAASTPLGQALAAAFAKVMALPNLVALFGEGATRNPREPFADHFLARTRWALEHQSADGNPFLAQMLLGRFTRGAEHEWLKVPRPERMPEVTWTIGPMAEALAASEPGSFDVVHLSNILDWHSPQDARATLELSRSALRPGGWVIARQLNSTLDLETLGTGIDWRRDEGKELLARDRSFFYSAIHVGRRP
jgi:S-adenosylmethionine-diacylglycerol 3-amino-3-carboxypropyl transferase